MDEDNYILIGLKDIKSNLKDLTSTTQKLSVSLGKVEEHILNINRSIDTDRNIIDEHSKEIIKNKISLARILGGSAAVSALISGLLVLLVNLM